jgi:hypothetical protein
MIRCTFRLGLKERHDGDLWTIASTTKVRFGLMRNNSGEVIVDFLLSPAVSDEVTFSCLRYTRAPDGKGLIA